ncbi:MAG TPA: hypothetical protein VGN57_15535 [Pirellulaceae bacterium]|jgi:hypothetical protein|nr:hypothetical protein [Pirellulaceae bacterium]
MFRWLLVLSLIATLVACPFRCGGALGVVCASEATSAAGIEADGCGCDRCREEGPAKRESDPDSPRPEPCDCGSCVCEGALLDGSAPAPSVEEGAGVILFESTPPELVRVRVARSPDFWNDIDPSGRTLRVLRQSFQI